MFNWEKGALNQEQEEAVRRKGSVLLTACPGSGKTRVLTYKIACELDLLDSKGQFVVAITYTNTAANEMKERVESLGVNTKQLWIGTIHSFCLEWVLRPYHSYLNELNYGFRIISPFDAEKLLTELCEKYSINIKVTYWDCGIIATPSGYFFTCLDVRKHDVLEKIYNEYFHTLKTNRQIDFEQVLYYSYNLLANNPIICNILSKIFPIILIDEYQDTKEIQYHIIANILKANYGDSKAFIVGDPNQSIYQSLGGYPMEKDDLEKLLGFKLAKLSLTRNYRSSNKIIDYFNYFRTYSNSIIASGNDKEYPSIITYNIDVSINDIIEEIASLILFNVNRKNISPNEICIVAPQWVHIASVTRRLMIRLPEYSFDGPGMAPFSRDIDNFWFKVSRIALTEPSPHMYIRRLRWSNEVLNELDLIGADVSNVSAKKLLRICNSIYIDENNGLKYLSKFFTQICNHLSILIDSYEMLYEHYNAFFESSKSRIDRLIKEGNPLIDQIESFKKVFRQKDGITVSTIHGVKGEEYDTMIGFALLDDYLPHFADLNGEANAKKILYVLASRARKNLHIISEYGRGVNRMSPEGKQPTPSLYRYKYTYDSIT